MQLLIEDYTVDRIAALCKKQKISGYKLSQITGISQSSISNLLNKKQLPNLVTLDKICKAFGITIVQFFYDDLGLLGLTEEQKELLMVWEDLKPEERVFLQKCMSNYKKNK